jgi:hypothetical protein
VSSDSQRWGPACDTGNVLASTPLGGAELPRATSRAAAMRTRFMATVITAGSVIALAGCGTGTATPPQPVQSTSTQAANPIPPVKNPRDVAAIAHRTCDLLTPQQAKNLGLDVPPTPSDGPFGTQYCVWQNITSEGLMTKRLSVSVTTNNATLEVSYNQYRSRPDFNLVEIAGYPALISRSNVNLPSCDIDIKLAERQSVSITYIAREFSSNPQQSCVAAKQVMAAVVMNVPPKS